MIPHFIEDFKRVEQEAIDNMRRRTGGGHMGAVSKDKKAKLREDIADIMDACGIKLSDRDMARFIRHIHILIEETVDGADKRNAEEVVLNVLRSLGMRELVNEYKKKAV
ncbi:MAG: hypothetical protein KGI49_03320 [Patescibacteria group bacterium]|nr:hypothetical protein [Patescibacteria group bacterium]